jgi:hypothetical protein
VTDTRTINELVNDCLLKWVEVTNVDLSKTSWTISFHFAGEWTEYDLQVATEELNTSRELDPTGLTTFMMLRGLTESFLKAESYSAYDLIVKPGPVRDRLKALAELRLLVEDPFVVELVEEFLVKIRAAAEEFSFKDRDGLEALLADRYKVGHVRRDALLSMEKLSAHQFTQGKGDPLPIRFNPHVWEFWNVNSPVRALRDQRVPGISTVLIRDPEALHSFFVFGIKNGDVITVLTDKDEEAHPAQKRMSRRPDRQMWERASKHWFPYQLLDLKTTTDGHTYAKQRAALVPIDAVGLKLKPLGELNPAQFVWTLLMYELIRDKFWRQNYQLPELSYTGEMVAEPESLIGAGSALVRTGLYTPLILDPITPDGVTSKSTAEQWWRQPTYFYHYMVDHYVDNVPADVYNVVGEVQRNRLQRSLKLIGKDHFGATQELVRLETLDPQNFGLRKKLEDDRLWAARHNQMQMIQHAAEKEYERDHKKIAKWWQEHVRANSEFLLNAAARGELTLPVWNGRGNPEEDRKNPFPGDVRDPFVVVKNGLEQYEAKRPQPGSWFSHEYHGDVVLGDWQQRAPHHTCCERRGVRATIFTEIQPTCPEALALVVGMKVEDLPWPLQHWHPEWAGEPYDGNCILNRTDPVDWVLTDPWRKQGYRILICHSKRAFIARRKALGITSDLELPCEDRKDRGPMVIKFGRRRR